MLQDFATIGIQHVELQSSEHFTAVIVTHASIVCWCYFPYNICDLVLLIFNFLGAVCSSFI